jgi:hypothetical protein
VDGSIRGPDTESSGVHCFLGFVAAGAAALFVEV